MQINDAIIKYVSGQELIDSILNTKVKIGVSKKDGDIYLTRAELAKIDENKTYPIAVPYGTNERFMKAVNLFKSKGFSAEEININSIKAGKEQTLDNYMKNMIFGSNYSDSVNWSKVKPLFIRTDDKNDNTITSTGSFLVSYKDAPDYKFKITLGENNSFKIGEYGRTNNAYLSKEALPLTKDGVDEVIDLIVGQKGYVNYRSKLAEAAKELEKESATNVKNYRIEMGMLNNLMKKSDSAFKEYLNSKGIEVHPHGKQKNKQADIILNYGVGYTKTYSIDDEEPKKEDVFNEIIGECDNAIADINENIFKNDEGNEIVTLNTVTEKDVSYSTRGEFLTDLDKYRYYSYDVDAFLEGASKDVEKANEGVPSTYESIRKIPGVKRIIPPSDLSDDEYINFYKNLENEYQKNQVHVKKYSYDEDKDVRNRKTNELSTKQFEQKRYTINLRYGMENGYIRTKLKNDNGRRMISHDAEYYLKVSLKFNVADIFNTLSYQSSSKFFDDSVNLNVTPEELVMYDSMSTEELLDTTIGSVLETSSWIKGEPECMIRDDVAEIKFVYDPRDYFENESDFEQTMLNDLSEYDIVKYDIFCDDEDGRLEAEVIIEIPLSDLGNYEDE